MTTSIRAGGWLNAALQRLSELAELQAGWDDAAAPRIDPDLIEVVKEFLSSDLISGLTVQPDIVPTFEGGLLIEWHTQSLDLIIEAAVSGRPSFYFRNSETGEEVEAPLGQRLDAIGVAFTDLAQTER